MTSIENIIEVEQNTIPTPWDDRFSTELVKIGKDKSIQVAKLRISTASLYHVSLTILAEYEYLNCNPDVKNNKLKSLYEEIVTRSSTKINILQMAKKIVGFFDSYTNEKGRSDFINSTICMNWKWSGETEGKRAIGYMFSKQEERVNLLRAKIMLLVKAFRMYLIETVQDVFREYEEEDWDVENATYRVRVNGSIVKKSSPEFINVVNNIYKMYKKITELSTDLREIKNVVKEVEELEQSERRKEERKKRQEEVALKLKEEKEANEKKLSEKTVKTEPWKNMTFAPSPIIENKWKIAKPLIVMDEEAKRQEELKAKEVEEVKEQKPKVFKPHKFTPRRFNNREQNTKVVTKV